MTILSPVATDRVTPKVSEWCRLWLGSPVAHVLFETGFTSQVFGVRLAEGPEMVVETRRHTPTLVGQP